MDTDRSIPQMLPAVLDDIQTPYPERIITEARRVYGPQLTTAFHPLRYLLQGSFPTVDITRWYQANQMVCSGTTPAGTEADFGERHGSWSKRVKEQKTEYVERSLSEVLVYTPRPISEYLRKASDLATRIRGHQTLRDGNHRTSLLCFILTLAESHVILRSDFSLFRAYITVSARQHPSNRDNVLLEDAIQDTAASLFRYARRRVKPGVADWEYLARWSEEVRRLPVYVAHIEATYEYVRKLQEPESRKDGLKEQLRRWNELKEVERRHILLAHPAFSPGVFRKKGNWAK